MLRAVVVTALNRVSIARRRYDEAALAYNKESIARGLIMRERLQASSEVLRSTP